MLLYATTAATRLTICTDKLDPAKERRAVAAGAAAREERACAGAERSTRARIGGAEVALASSRLLPATFDPPAFEDVAALMNDSSQDAQMFLLWSAAC